MWPTTTRAGSPPTLTLSAPLWPGCTLHRLRRSGGMNGWCVSSSSPPVRRPSAPEDTSAVDRILPFPVTINAFYLVNPNEDDDGYPFWIAQIATKGTLTPITSTRLTVHPPQQRRLKGSGPAAFGGYTQSRLSEFNKGKARLRNSERRRWPSLTTIVTPTR